MLNAFEKPLFFCIFIVSLLVLVAINFCYIEHYKHLGANETNSLKSIDLQSHTLDSFIKDNSINEHNKNIMKIKRNFIDNGVIDNKYINKESIYFLINQKYPSKEWINFIKSRINAIGDYKLIIISGFACDLGNVEYNKRLTQDRINNVINLINKDNPSLDILFANNGAAISWAHIKDVKERAKKRSKERRVDIYFYK